MNRTLLVVLILCLLAASCAKEPTPTPDLVATQIAVEKAAHATMTAEAILMASPTPEPLPTEPPPTAAPPTEPPATEPPPTQPPPTEPPPTQPPPTQPPATQPPATQPSPTQTPATQAQGPDRSMWGFDLREDTLELHRSYSGQLMGVSRWTDPRVLANAEGLGGSIIVSHPDPEALLTLADSLPIKPGWVSIDLESWENTPPDVRDNPVAAARLLVDEAHARGYRVMFFMARNYYRQHQAEAVEIAKFVDGWLFPAQQIQLQYGPDAGWAGEVAALIQPVADSNPNIPLWLKLHVTHANSGSRWTAQEAIAYCEAVSDRIDGCFLYDIRDRATGTLTEILASEPSPR